MVWNPFINTPAGAGGGGGLSSIPIADEGVPQGNVTSFDFTGAGVTATVAAGVATINIPGGGGAHPDPHLLGNGTAAAPTYSFASVTNMGMYTDGTVLNFSVGGADRLQITTAEIFQNVTQKAISGSASSPSYTFQADTNSGLYSISNDVMGIAIGGIQNSTFQAGLWQVVKGSADTISYAINARKSRGTVASPTVITSGDDLLTINAFGYVGATNTYQEAARITFDSTGTISDSATGIGGLILLSVATVGGEPTDVLRIAGNSVQILSTNNPYFSVNRTTGVSTDVDIGFRNVRGTGFFAPSNSELSVACSDREMVRWKAASAGGGWQIMDEADSNPTTTELDSLDSIAIYNKADKLIFAYNNAGTITYISIPLDGSSTAWTHNTTAP